MTSPLREMAGRDRRDGHGRLLAAGSPTTSRDEIGALARAFNADGRRARGDRPRAPRPRRQREPRAAHADHRAPGRAREPRRRRRRPRPRDAAHDARPGRAARPAREAAPRPLAARSRAPCRSTVGSSRSSCCSSTRCASQQLHAPDVDDRRRASSRADLDSRRRPRARCTRSSPTSLENAVRHSPPRRHGRGARRAGPRRRDASRCIDEGPGIPEREADRVSSNASTAPTPRASSSDGGAGLGLAIARWIVDLHGGEIHPERREPHGCRMVVTCRARAEHQSEPPVRAPDRDDHTSRGTPTMALTPIDEALQADPPRRDGPRRRRRGPRERGRPHDGREWVTPKSINFMLRWARGLVCMPCRGEHLLDALERRGRWCPPGEAGCDTAFTVSIDHLGAGQRHRCGRPRAHDPACARARRRGPSDFRPPRSRVPAAGPARRCARAPRPHRGRGRPRPARRAARRSR